MSTINAVLITRCGCSREFSVRAGSPACMVPIREDVNWSSPDTMPTSLRTRTFVRRRDMDAKFGDGMPVYYEESPR